MAIGDDRGSLPWRREPPADAPRSLVRNFAVVIVLKACALVAIWQVWFAAPAPRDAAGTAAAAHLLDHPAPPARPRREPDAGS